ncbi:MAG: flagellar hook capping FlgD N-terminal domain-containing protein [Pseudomonadota bacterium]
MENVTNPPLLPTQPAAATPPPPPTENGEAGNPTADSASTAAGDFESFLTLLTAQLRNQDPLQPLDSTTFVAQLASFSTVEQLIGVNDRLDSLSDAGSSSDLTALAGWIGREAAATDGRFVADGDDLTVTIPAEDGATTARLDILDASGTVRTSLEASPGAEVTWNGNAASGASLAGETLRLRAVYTDAEGTSSETVIPVYHTITALRGGADGPVLDRADGLALPPGDVATLRAPPEED